MVYGLSVRMLTFKEVERFRVDLTRYGDEPRFPSDHRALSADVVLLP